MSVPCQVIMSAVEKVAPRYLAEEWDNVGLLLGNPSQSVERVLVTLDCTQAVVDEAIAEKADLILAHHPLIFKPLKQVRSDLPAQKPIADLLRHNIMFYAAHTNLDSCALSGSVILAEMLGLQEQDYLLPGYKEQLFKVVVFVPQEYSLKVREAMAKAGAGCSGNYDTCFFQALGTGTFRPLPGAQPFIGQIGKTEEVGEARLETITTAHDLDRVIRAMLKAHPYEVPAYDILPTQNPGPQFGIGRIGSLPEEEPLGNIVEKINQFLGLNKIQVAGDLDKKIKKAAVSTGSGGSLIKKAAFKGAGVLIAGDISHHEALDALAEGMAIIDPGHYATEWFMVENLMNHLVKVMQANKKPIEFKLSTINTNPFMIV